MRDSPLYRIREPVLLAAVSLILFWVTVRWAGVSHADQNFYLFALGLLAVAAGLWPRRPNAERLSPVYRYALPLVPLYAALQLVPLPVSWIVALSPARALGLDGLARAGLASNWAALSVFPTGTRDQLLLLCGYIVVFLLVRQVFLAFPNHPWIVAVPILVLAGGEALLGIVQHAAGPEGTAANGTYSNRNHFAGLLELSIPFAVALPLAYLRKRIAREDLSVGDALKIAGLWSLAAAFLVAVIFSESRMGFIGALFSIFVVGILGVATRSHVLPSRRAVFLSAATVGITVALIFVFLPTDELIRRYAQAVVDVSEEQGPETRLQIWRETLPLIRAYPVFGCGLGGYAAAFPRFKTVAPLSTGDHAHNDYLQIAAETGLLGTIIFITLAAATVSYALHNAFTASHPADWAIALACNGSLAAILLHSTVDYNLYIPANALIVSWIAAIATVGRQDRRNLLCSE